MMTPWRKKKKKNYRSSQEKSTLYGRKRRVLYLKEDVLGLPQGMSKRINKKKNLSVAMKARNRDSLGLNVLIWKSQRRRRSFHKGKKEGTYEYLRRLLLLIIMRRIKGGNKYMPYGRQH